MLEKLTYKQKFYLAIAGFLISLVLVYSIAIKGTLAIKKECKELKYKIMQVENAPVKVASLEREIAKLEGLMSNVNSELSVNEKLLEVTARFAERNRLVLKEFPETHTYTKQDYSIYTDAITLEGGFINLLRLLYLIETEKSYGRVSSVDFYSYLDKRKKTYNLNMIIYVQNIQHISDKAPH